MKEGFKGTSCPLRKGVPITPDDIPEAKVAVIPAVVFDVVNELLVLKSVGKNAAITLLQKDIVAEVQKRIDTKFQIEWLNFEDAYRSAGWEVTYDRPAYCESYDANFTFKRNSYFFNRPVLNMRIDTGEDL